MLDQHLQWYSRAVIVHKMKLRSFSLLRSSSLLCCRFPACLPKDKNQRGPDNKNNLVFTCFPSILPSVHANLKIRFPFHTNTRKKDGCVHSVWVSTCLHLKNKKCVPETKRRGSYWHLCLIPILSHYFNSIFPIFNFQTRQYIQIYHSVHTDDNKKRSQSRSSAEAPDISALFFT